MKGIAAKSKVVTSGRLTGKVKVQPARKRVPPDPGAAACPEPAYSLYSTDSEDQVTSLYTGLDRCAALLSGILQAEKAEALPTLPRAVKGGAAKSRPSTSLGKKSIKKLPTHTEQKRCQSVQRGADSTTPRRTHTAVPTAHSGVKLHPPHKHPQTPLQSQLVCSLQHLSPTIPPPQTSSRLSGRLTLPHTDCQSAPEAAHTHCEEEDVVPVRDTDTHSTASDTDTDTHTHTHTHTCTLEMSNMQLERGQVDDVREGSSAETQGKMKTVQYLMEELKALIAGQGSVAERLLSHLEQTVSSPLMNVSHSNIQTEPELLSLHSQNTQLRRRVRTLQQQLKQRERQQNMDTLCDSEVLSLQEALSTAQSRLQELQDDLTELRKALQDTQSQLRDTEAENTLIKTDLEATRSRLQDSEREKSELALLAQQRLEEIEHLNRTLQSVKSSARPPVVDSSVSDTLQQHRQNPADPPTDSVTHFLLSLGQHVCVGAERDGDTPEPKKLTSVQLRDTSSHPDVRPHGGDKPAEMSAHHHNAHLDQSQCLAQVQSCGRQLDSTLSQCDKESVCSDWSMRSGSTIDTRAEAAFRDGLSALDASIASLQRTIQLDLRS